MKIADVECVMLQGSGDQGIYGAPYGAVVRVTTEDGLVGYGEANSHPRLIKAAVEAEYHNALMSGLNSPLKKASLDRSRHGLILLKHIAGLKAVSPSSETMRTI